MQAALVLDLDGTLVPTEHMVYEVWREYFAEHGHDLSIERWAQCIGGVGFPEEFDPLAEAVRLGFGEREAIQAQLKVQERERAETLSANPGADALVRAAVAADVPLGVASSSSTRWVVGHLERQGWRPHIASVRTRDHGPGKPSAALYEMVMDDLGADPARSWAIEDSHPGVTAAKAAGLRVVAVPHSLTATHDVSAADMVVDSLEAITLDMLGLAGAQGAARADGRG